MTITGHPQSVSQAVGILEQKVAKAAAETLSEDEAQALALSYARSKLGPAKMSAQEQTACEFLVKYIISQNSDGRAATQNISVSALAATISGGSLEEILGAKKTGELLSALLDKRFGGTLMGFLQHHSAHFKITRDLTLAVWRAQLPRQPVQV